jgi:maleylacetate reductase
MRSGRRWYQRRWDNRARTPPTFLDRFIRGLGLPRSLRDVRVSPEHFDAIAEQAMRTPWIPRNPRNIDTPAQVREILLLAA